MDEVENPALPAADEQSPTIPPVADEVEAAAAIDEEVKLPLDTAEAEQLVDSANPSPTTQPAQPAAPVPQARQGLQREAPVPPPVQPPPAPPAQPAQPTETSDFPTDPPDSLTLADLKRIRSSFPNTQPPPQQGLLSEDDHVYDFEYQDAQSLPVEIEEWFSYSEREEVALRKCKSMFNQEWRASQRQRKGADMSEETETRDWVDVTEDERREFVKREIHALKVTNGKSVSSLMMLVYIALGAWEETAGRTEGTSLDEMFPGGNRGGGGLGRYGNSSMQIQWIVAMVDTLHASDGLKVIYDCLRERADESFAASPADSAGRNEAQPKRGDESMELWCCLTLLYLFIEVARTTEGISGKALKSDILALEPKLVNYMTQLVAKLRWDDYAPLPLTKLLLLSWKTILVTFGGIKDVEHVKASLRSGPEEEKDARGQPIITASPLDYHLFRQEISSKYPAYQPPKPLFPFEPENNSILPPLKHRRPSYASVSESAFSAAPDVGTSSIMHQPVHIATPAPSPPPSPAGPGKAGKKQNYQTNQMFPFLYPPLDEKSGELGGKGSTQLQDALVGRKWEGGDVPTSILEAAELFSKRMRATRAMKQLWEVRVDYMKFERGWKGGGPDDDRGQAVLDDQDEDNDVDEFELLPTPAPEETAPQGQPVRQTEEEKKLAAVSDYYRDSLPHMQSLVIVLLKAVLQNVTDLVTRTNGQNGGLGAGIQFNDTNGTSATRPAENGVNGIHEGFENTPAEELDKLRTQEVGGKALSATLLLLLKWFKVSHILQYEYLTQLLLDSNYVPLVLKLWQTQDIGRTCHYKLDKEESGFFYFCQANSRQGPPPGRGNEGRETVFEESEEDDAAPPPIKLKRDETATHENTQLADAYVEPQQPELPPNQPPEVDELGYPVTPFPTDPLKSYSWRNTFTTINHLRTLQKLTRRKTHRALLLVSYKSSTHLRKHLKLPIPLMRYYTLKLFKSQVPFCGRKWRQSNMKIITAVWLSVPAELRDDWLSGGGGGVGGAGVGDVDGSVEDAVPLEQGMRGLVHWWNVRNFPEVLGVEPGVLEQEDDFFTRELEKMGFVDGLVGDDGIGLGDDGQGNEEGWQGPIEGY
ncbi:hypothetical protein D0863_11633 [Hortaea werneckii]|uniref:Far11/STRP C-terminal domain-containing protein n=1 Tax=Hortaea werneckii TaxID=91943 RepID=A0A3M7D8I0_HORWE|nr:hypothetical protein D0863_11633 [Hortaea werneckii]